MNILKQTWAQLKAQKMLTWLGIAGTALAMFLIMIVVMMQQVKILPVAPESKRPLMLHASYGSIISNEHEEYESNGPMSYETCEVLYGKLREKPEVQAVAIYSYAEDGQSVNAPGSDPRTASARGANADFFKVFDFSFVSGRPYDDAEAEAGRPLVVITAGLARAIYGTEEAAGRDIEINYAPYRVVGVVEDVSTLTSNAYANIWIPAKASPQYGNRWNTVMGAFHATLLARDKSDFDAIRTECDRLMAQYNKEIEPTGWHFVSRNRPYPHEWTTGENWANVEPDYAGQQRRQYIIYLILLLVPAINLSGMTDSRLRRRVEEIGVRRAFGITRLKLFLQMIGENLIVTVAAGIIGWLMSVAFLMLCGGWLIQQDTDLPAPTLDVLTLLNPTIFLTALLFCFLLNVMSSGIPVWRASRTNIVNALNKH